MSMSGIQDAIAAHHKALTDTLAEQVRLLEEGTSDPARLVAFLKTELLPHAAGEEWYLYPVMNDLIREHGSATATMHIDHEYIAEASRRIEELAQAEHQTADERVQQRVRLVRLAAQLEAILRLHVDKEERAYLPLFAQYLPASEQQRILNAMHETADVERPSHEGETQEDKDIELDVRPLPPTQRHALIFRTFDALPGGGAFVLVNDHDPKPLYYQLNAERQGELVWEYLEEGPTVWRVRIGKVA